MDCRWWDRAIKGTYETDREPRSIRAITQRRKSILEESGRDHANRLLEENEEEEGWGKIIVFIGEARRFINCENPFTTET